MRCGFFSLLLRSKSGASWSAPVVHPLTQWLGAAVGADLSWLPVRHGFWKNFLFYVPALPCCSHLENWTLLLRPCIFQLIPAFGCCLWSTSYSGRVLCLVQQWIHGLRKAFGELHIFSPCGELRSEASALHSCRMEKRAQSMLLVAASLSAVRTWEVDIISTSAPCLTVSGNFRCVPHFSGPSMMKNSSSSRAHAN